MKTPNSYINNVKKGLITEEMLSDCLYSLNKRAKNYRDKENDIRSERCQNPYFYDKYGNEEKYREKKEKLYSDKEFLLSLYKPTCVHRVTRTELHRTRIYSYDPEFYEIADEDVAHSGEYYDRDTGEFVEFKDIIEEETYNEYFLCWKIGNGSFHRPINNPQEYDLPIEDIGDLRTYGKNIIDLISLNFVNKVISLIKSGKYTLTT